MTDRKLIAVLAAGLEALACGQRQRAARLFARVQDLAGEPVLLPFAADDDEMVDLAEVTALCERARRERQ